MPYFPTSEAHYLTSAGDVVDKICWDYYGVTKETTERVYVRNPYLADFKAILPAGLLLVLPIIAASDVLPQSRLWNYTEPTLPELFVTTQRDDRALALAAEKDAEAAALSVYQSRRNYVTAVDAITGAGTPGDGSTPDDGGSGPGGTPDPDAPSVPVGTWENELEPLTVSDFDFITVWYRTEAGKWGLGKIAKSSFGEKITNTIVDHLPAPSEFPEGWFPSTAQMVISLGGGAPTLQTVQVLARSS